MVIIISNLKTHAIVQVLWPLTISRHYTQKACSESWVLNHQAGQIQNSFCTPNWGQVEEYPFPDLQKHYCLHPSCVVKWVHEILHALRFAPCISLKNPQWQRLNHFANTSFQSHYLRWAENLFCKVKQKRVYIDKLLDSQFYCWKQFNNTTLMRRTSSTLMSVMEYVSGLKTLEKTGVQLWEGQRSSQSHYWMKTGRPEWQESHTGSRWTWVPHHSDHLHEHSDNLKKKKKGGKEKGP